MNRLIKKFVGTKAPAKTGRPKKARLGVESLECRALMSGNVAVGIVNGVLQINGDDYSNSIEVQRIYKGPLRIQSLDGSTTVNNQAYYDVTGGFSDMVINFGGGNDYVYLHDLYVNRDMRINYGSGNDWSDIANVTTGDDMLLNFGTGTSDEGTSIVNSQVGTGSYYNNDLSITGSSNKQYLYLYNVVVQDDLYADVAASNSEVDDVDIYNVQVLGEADGGLARIRAYSIRGDNLDAETDVDLEYTGDVNLTGVQAGDDIWVDGRDLSATGDMIKITADFVGDDFRIRGHGGNDYIEVFGSYDVRIEGGAGDDTAKGGGGDDVLIGGSGTDRVYGNGGNDWLEAGSLSEYYSGGTGQDWNAHRVATGGATFDDVFQTATPTCSFLSSLSSLALREGSNFLLNKISYVGNFTYLVNLFDASGNFSPQMVTFDGTLYNWEPTIDAEYESWVIIFQRAYLQQRGLDYTNQSDATGSDAGAWPHETLTMLTGQASETHWTSDFWSSAGAIEDGVNAGRNVIVATLNSSSIDGLLVRNHAYTVVNSDLTWNWNTWKWEGTVTLRNPWGNDGGSGFGVTTDGIVTIDIDALWSSISGVFVN